MPPQTLTPAAPATQAPARLTRADRCDTSECSAQAFIEATHADQPNLKLLFCGHHGRNHEPGLIAKGFVIHDETHRINAVSASSA